MTIGLKKQKDFLSAFWSPFPGQDKRGRAHAGYLDLCVYELLCAAEARTDAAALPQKELSGEGYEGHYFWDCEIYAFPFFLASAPEMAKKRLLDYR
jgi:alpha,alpha-trehalose phosphorylase